MYSDILLGSPQWHIHCKATVRSQGTHSVYESVDSPMSHHHTRASALRNETKRYKEASRSDVEVPNADIRSCDLLPLKT